MTARDDLVRAAEALIARGELTFPPIDLIAQARSLGSTYPESTLRAHIGDHMRVDKGRRPPGFAKGSDGRYGLVTEGSKVGFGPVPAATPVPAPALVTDEPDWLWEGNVQALVVRHLVHEGWSIVRVADTASREQGVDIEARRGDEHLLVEVKGYPSATYRSGPDVGQPKKAGAGPQARNHFAGGVLTGLLLRSDHPRARVAVAFPAMETYRTLARRTAGPLHAAAIELWLVSPGAEIEVVPAARAAGA